MSLKQKIRLILTELAQAFFNLLDTIWKNTQPLSDKISTLPSNAVNQALEIVLQKDKELRNLLIELVKQQEYQAQIDQVKKQVEEKNKELNSLSNALQVVHSKLTNVLHETKQILDSINKTSMKMEETDVNTHLEQLEVQEIVTYAHRCASTTSAPWNYVEGAPLYRYAPPCPQPHQWSASLLYPHNLQAHKAKLQEIQPSLVQVKKEEVKENGTKEAIFIPPPLPPTYGFTSFMKSPTSDEEGQIRLLGMGDESDSSSSDEESTSDDN